MTPPFRGRDVMAERFAALIRYCGAREWVNPVAIARGFGCHPRTVCRMLEALERQEFLVPRWRSDGEA